MARGPADDHGPAGKQALPGDAGNDEVDAFGGCDAFDGFRRVAFFDQDSGFVDGITEIGAQPLADPLLRDGHGIRRTLPRGNGTPAIAEGRFFDFLEDMHDHQLRLLAGCNRNRTLQCAITPRAQVGREQHFAWSAWVGS